MKPIFLIAIVPMAVLGLGKALGLLQKVMLARILSVDDYGSFNLLFAAMSFLATLCVLGMQKGVIRDIPSAIAEDSSNRIRGLLFAPAIYTFFLALIASIVLYQLWLADGKLGIVISSGFWWLLLCIPAQSLLLLVSYYLLAFGQSNFFLLGSQLLFNAIFFLFLLNPFFSGQTNIQTVVYLFSVASCISFIIISVLLGNTLYSKGLLSKLRIDFPNKQFYSYSLTLLISTLSYIALSSVDRIMLGALRGTSEVAFYSVAYTVAATMPIFMIAVDAIVSPKLASANANKDKPLMQSLYQRSNNILLLIASMVTAIMILFADEIVSIFGESYSYSDTAYLMLILLVGEYINVVLGTTGRVLQVTGHHKIEAKLVVYAVLINVILNAIFIPLFGVEGAVWATVVTRLFHTLSKTFLVIRRLGFNPWNRSEIIGNTSLLLIIISLFLYKLSKVAFN